jgi:membrane protein
VTEGPDENARSGVAESGTDAALSRLPPRLRRVTAWLLIRWPGRIAVRSARGCLRIDIFDRSMTIAAQIFSSVLPVLILFATWSSAADRRKIADAVNMPAESRSVLEDAVQGAGSAAFGIVGSLIVLVSATSLSRALTRAFALAWDLPRPRSRLASAWRWLAAVLVLALSLVVVGVLSGPASELPPPHVWQWALALTCDFAVALLLPWMLLSGAVNRWLLAPGAALFALLMLAIRPASAVWLPRALEVSDERYGSIGVAFTYLAWLYVVSFCLLGTAVVGQVIATDTGSLGRWFQERSSVRPTDDLPHDAPA